MARAKGVWPAAGVIAVLAVATAVLQAGLPHDTFFGGDSGVKLIAARAAAAHPSRPLTIDLPTIGGSPQPFVDPFFVIHGDHRHAATSEVFALASAPLIALWGLSGAYVLPAIGWLAAVAGIAWLGVLLDRRRSPALLALVAAICTPFAFYGLEFWEHAPALGAASLGAAMSLDPAASRTRAAAGGFLLGLSILLRAEALWFAAAILAGLPLLPVRLRRATLVSAAIGCAAAIVPLVAYSLVHFGSLLTPHLAANEALMLRDWLQSRAVVTSRWSMPPFISGTAERIDFWSVAPAMLLAFVPLPQGSRRSGRPFLVAVASVDVVLVAASAPNDGGAQWGPRYLLFAYIPVSVLAADALAWLMSRRGVTAVAALAIVLWALWIDRSAYRSLRTTKRIYARMVSFVDRESAAEGLIVSDLWWLDQVAASLTPDRTFLYAADSDRRQMLMRTLERAGVPSAVIVGSDDPPSVDVDSWLGGTCYRPLATGTLVNRHLRATHIRRRCPPERAE